MEIKYLNANGVWCMKYVVEPLRYVVVSILEKERAGVNLKLKSLKKEG